MADETGAANRKECVKYSIHRRLTFYSKSFYLGLYVAVGTPLIPLASIVLLPREKTGAGEELDAVATVRNSIAVDPDRRRWRQQPTSRP